MFIRSNFSLFFPLIRKFPLLFTQTVVLPFRNSTEELNKYQFLRFLSSDLPPREMLEIPQRNTLTVHVSDQENPIVFDSNFESGNLSTVEHTGNYNVTNFVFAHILMKAHLVHHKHGPRRLRQQTDVLFTFMVLLQCERFTK